MEFEEKVRRIIADIKALDNSRLTHAAVEGLLEQIEPMAILDIPITVGAGIFRTRCSDAFPSFCSEKDISYCPLPEYVKIGRANKTEEPIFYGSVMFIKNPNEKPDETHARSVCYAETSSLTEKEEGEEYLSTGIWTVRKPIKAAAIVHHGNFKQPNAHIQYLKSWYDKFARKHIVLMKGLNIFNEFMADEFAKEVMHGDNKGYMVSSSFAEMLFNYGYEAILYPSVKAEGSGFNIAMLPEIVDSKLEFKAGLVERAYKANKQVVVQPKLKAVHIKDNKLVWEENNKFGRATVLQMLRG